MIDLCSQEIKVYKVVEDNSDEAAYGRPPLKYCGVLPCRFVRASKRYKNNIGIESIADAEIQVPNESIAVGTVVKYCNEAFEVVNMQEWRDGEGGLYGSRMLLTYNPEAVYEIEA
jgi:hypothetical protein